jgi:type IV secretion system protein VirB10
MTRPNAGVGAETDEALPELEALGQGDDPSLPTMPFVVSNSSVALFWSCWALLPAIWFSPAGSRRSATCSTATRSSPPRRFVLHPSCAREPEPEPPAPEMVQIPPPPPPPPAEEADTTEFEVHRRLFPVRHRRRKLSKPAEEFPERFRSKLVVVDNATAGGQDNLTGNEGRS